MSTTNTAETSEFKPRLGAKRTRYCTQSAHGHTDQPKQSAAVDHSSGQPVR